MKNKLKAHLVNSYVYIEDVPILKWPLIWYTVTNHFVDRPVYNN